MKIVGVLIALILIGFLPVWLEGGKWVNTWSKVIPNKAPTEAVKEHENTQYTFQTFTLGVGESKTIGTLSLTLLNIENDSRCPEGVQCIWSGEIVARIQLQEGTTTQEVSISNVTNQVETQQSEDEVFKTNQITFGEYKIKLVDATPYPIADKERTEPYQVTFVVSK